ncbi:hypothetical protein [Desulfonatronovibrio magnus]|uniref:hypothetical protein n=1 Tax=Desulfonatronovibrio magnus TaxID=698827 RepID=UPI0005EB840E|nr:hypothetical protein [Desulfonatronovibrio magnus]
MSAQKLKVFLLTLFLIFLFVVFKANASDAKYYQVNSKQSMCEDAENGRVSFRYQVGSFSEPTAQYQKFFVPPHLLDFGVLVPIKMGSGNVKVAVRYGTPPGDYPPHYEEYTHTIPPLYPVRSFEQAREDNVIRVGAGGSETYALMNITNPDRLIGDPDGNWLYFNIFNQKERLLSLTYGFFIDKEPFLKWCAGGVMGPPAPPRVTANHSSTTSPITIEFSSQGADKICYTQSTGTGADSIPEVPKDPGQPGEDDKCISGSSGSLKIDAKSGEYRIDKFNFRAKNEEGWSGVTSREYRLDLRPLVAEAVQVEPGSTEVDGNSINLSISSDNSTKIFYNIVEKTSSSGVPDDPDPDQLGSYKDWAEYKTGPSNTLPLSTTQGVHKKVAVQFVGYNANNEEQPYGVVSAVHYYSMKGTSLVPGKVIVDPPSGSFDDRKSLEIQCENSTHIYYSYSLDGKEPDDPTKSLFRITGPKGTLNTPGDAGKTNNLKMRFAGYNSDNSEWGPVSEVYSYTVRIPGSTPTPAPTPTPSPSPSPSPAPSDPEECTSKGGVWFFGRCIMPSSSPTPSTGSIKVNIQPPSAAHSGAAWRRTGTSDWKASGEIENKLSPGSYSIEFMNVIGWLNPGVKTVTVQQGKIKEITAIYIPESSDLIFNWLESNYRDLFSPAPQQTKYVEEIFYRYYHETNIYIATYLDHLWVIDQDGEVYDLGSLESWLPFAQ